MFCCSGAYTARQHWTCVCDIANSKERQGLWCSVSPSTSLAIHIWMCSCGRHLSEEHHAPVSFCVLLLFAMMSLIVGIEQWRGDRPLIASHIASLTSYMVHTETPAPVFRPYDLIIALLIRAVIEVALSRSRCGTALPTAAWLLTAGLQIQCLSSFHWNLFGIDVTHCLI